MKILVIGGGLQGLCSAQALLERGHDVRLLEAHDGVGLETSFANGGLITPSKCEPWNAPGAWKHLLSSVVDRESAFRLRLRAIPSLTLWGLDFLKHSTAARYRASLKANFDLATYSKQKTSELRQRLGLSFDHASSGTLNVYREGEAIDGLRHQSESLSQYGMRYEELDSQGVVSTEPALRYAKDLIKGAFYYPDDDSGDAYLFCTELRREIESGGAVVQTGTAATRLMVEQGRVTGVATDRGLIDAEVVLVAAGHRSPALVRSAGMSLPIKPAKGYSVTLNVENMDGVPRVPLIDETMHAAITPLGNRLRMSSTVEFAGFDKRVDPRRIRGLFTLLEELYPRLASKVDRGNSNPWAGLRPVSSDGLPFVGAGRLPGLYINAGHGPLGWTLAMGSAHLLADCIGGQPSEIDSRPFDPSRLARLTD
ncbi:MAG: FAD-dependent oxidoreductase [Woeseia sp.]